MNILVNTLNYLLFTYFYSILQIHHNTPLFITIPTNSTRISFPFPATPSTKVGTDRKIVRRRSSSCHPCRKKNRFDPNPQTRPGFRFLFWPRYRRRLVPIGSSCDAGHVHAILIAGNRSESCQSKPWKAAESPLQFAGFRWRNHLGFVPHNSLSLFWPTTTTGGADLPLIGRWRIHGFGRN